MDQEMILAIVSWSWILYGVTSKKDVRLDERSKQRK